MRVTIGGFVQDPERREGLGEVERIEGTSSADFTFKGAGHRDRARRFVELVPQVNRSGAAAVRGLSRAAVQVGAPSPTGALTFCDDLLALDDAAG